MNQLSLVCCWRRSPRISCLEYLKKNSFSCCAMFLLRDYAFIFHNSSNVPIHRESALLARSRTIFNFNFFSFFPRGNVASSSFLFSILWSSFLWYSRELIICTELFNYSCSFSSPRNSDLIMVPAPRRHIHPKNVVHHSSRLQALREKVAKANQKFMRRQHYQQSLMYDGSSENSKHRTRPEKCKHSLADLRDLSICRPHRRSS